MLNQPGPARLSKYFPDLAALYAPFLMAASQTQLTIKEATAIKVITSGVHRVFRWGADTTFAVADVLDAGVIGAGKDYYVYLCNDGLVRVSLNSTWPQGYDAQSSRKIGGFHTLCCGIGTIAGHPGTGFVAGAIIPTSVWCLNWRSSGLQEGMAYSAKARRWGMIYNQSNTGANTASAYGAVVTVSRTWMDHGDDLGAKGLRHQTDLEFQLMAKGSNQKTNVYGSQNPVTAGKCAPLLFTGAGLNDLTVSRANYVSPVTSANEAQEYEVEFDATGTPDTFKWRQRNPAASYGSYTAGVPIVAGPIALANGITITFAATTGHTLGNKWNIFVMNGLVDTANQRMVSHEFFEAMCGAWWQWLQDQGYRYDLGTPTYSAASQTLTIYHAAAPGGNPIYVKYGLDGTPYLCCDLATAGLDKVVSFGAYKLAIKHDANANTGLPLYFDYDATLPLRFLVNNTTYAKDTYAFSNDPTFMLILKHDGAAATNGVAVKYDDGADNRLEYVSPGAANATADLCSAGPTWGYQDAGNNEGSVYKQGTYGDIKLVAGGVWNSGAVCGPRCRAAGYSRWNAISDIGGRGCAEPR